MRTNLKIDLVGVSPGERGEILFPSHNAKKLFGSVVVPEEIDSPANPAVELVFRSAASIGGFSMSVGTRVIPRSQGAYVPVMKPDRIQDVSVPQIQGNTQTLKFTGGDLPNVVAGALLLVEIVSHDRARLQTEAAVELLAAFLSINVPAGGGGGSFNQAQVLRLVSLRA